MVLLNALATIKTVQTGIPIDYDVTSFSVNIGKLNRLIIMLQSLVDVIF